MLTFSQPSTIHLHNCALYTHSDDWELTHMQIQTIYRPLFPLKSSVLSKQEPTGKPRKWVLTANPPSRLKLSITIHFSPELRNMHGDLAKVRFPPLLEGSYGQQQLHRSAALTGLYILKCSTLLLHAHSK